MNTRILALAAAAALSFAVVAPSAQAMEMEFNMLTGAVYNELGARGFDTTGIMNLTLAEISQIKGLLDEGDMTSATRGQIEKILEN